MTRFRGHPITWVKGVHDAEVTSAVPNHTHLTPAGEIASPNSGARWNKVFFDKPTVLGCTSGGILDPAENCVQYQAVTYDYQWKLCIPNPFPRASAYLLVLTSSEDTCCDIVGTL